MVVPEAAAGVGVGPAVAAEDDTTVCGSDGTVTVARLVDAVLLVAGGRTVAMPEYCGILSIGWVIIAGEFSVLMAVLVAGPGWLSSFFILTVCAC
jgi:hypothetical protein